METESNRLLLPCPCCHGGGGESFMLRRTVSTDCFHYWVECECGLNTSERDSKEKVLKIWNNRREALKEAEDDGLPET